MSFFEKQANQENNQNLELLCIEEDILLDTPPLLKATVFRRTKSYYGVTQYISTINSADQSVINGQRAAYTKFSEVILENSQLYTKMGFFKQGEAQAQALSAATPVFLRLLEKSLKKV